MIFLPPSRTRALKISALSKRFLVDSSHLLRSQIFSATFSCNMACWSMVSVFLSTCSLTSAFQSSLTVVSGLSSGIASPHQNQVTDCQNSCTWKNKDLNDGGVFMNHHDMWRSKPWFMTITVFAVMFMKKQPLWPSSLPFPTDASPPVTFSLQPTEARIWTIKILQNATWMKFILLHVWCESNNR